MSLNFKLFRLFNPVSSRVLPSWSAKYAVNLFITPRRFQPKAWELEHESDGERLLIRDGLSALRWKPEDQVKNGRKVLLVHGWEGRATQMSSFVPALLDNGYEVISIDMPGHGDSAGEQSDIGVFADVILETEKQEGRFDAVIAHSMGGPSTAWAVRKGLDIDKLVLISSPSRMDMILKRFAGFMGLSNYASNLFVEFMSRHVGFHARDVDTVKLLSDFKGRLKLFHDENDQEVQVDQSRRVADKLNNAELIITQNLGHRRILGSDEVIARTTGFITADLLNERHKNAG